VRFFIETKHAVILDDQDRRLYQLAYMDLELEEGLKKEPYICSLSRVDGEDGW